VLRRAAPLLLLAAFMAGCGGGGGAEPQAAGPLGGDAFAGEPDAIVGGTVELSAFADQDLVVWFWSPW
jgi:hypothetical protein